jgi:hypothetical protein
MRILTIALFLAVSFAVFPACTGSETLVYPSPSPSPYGGPAR